MKICTKCNLEKTLDEFHNCKRNGKQSTCKVCKSHLSQKRRVEKGDELRDKDDKRILIRLKKIEKMPKNTTRTCSSCKDEKLLNNFSLNKGCLPRLCKKCQTLKRKPYKKCFTCKISKSRECFDGANITCTECHKKKNTKAYKDKQKKLANERNIRYFENHRRKVLLRSRLYSQNNPEKRRNTNIKYNSNNKEKIKKYKKEYAVKNKDKLSQKHKVYYMENKEKINQKNREKWIKNPKYKLRKTISLHIRNGLSGITKSGSILDKLPYTMKDLKDHLELLFEPWMSWDNWGVYNSKAWNDSNSLTWAWQIDHIIPHSSFKYTSMDCSEFKECWELSNLRPYSAKQNVIDGDRR